MKKVSIEILKNTANRLMFDMTDEEYEKLLNQFDVIIKQMELIGEIPGVDEAEPMVFPFDVTNSYLREDISSEPISRDDALKNCENVKDGQISLPKVVK